MFTVCLLPLLILIYYFNSVNYLTSLYLFIYLYTITHILYTGSMVDITTIIAFLNKLNNPLLNPTIFLIICIVINLFFFKKKQITLYRNLLIINMTFLLTNTNLMLFNIIETYKGSVSLTPTLTNGLLIIHPLILYSYYGVLLLFLFHTLYKSTKSLNKIYFYPFFLERNISYIIGIIALALGSWWSHQELNWGGFWSWDLVEIFLLITVTYSTYIIHSEKESKLYLYKALFFLFNFILYIISVRFNLINSIHNFFSQDSLLFKITYVLVFLFFILINLIINYFRNSRDSYTTKNFNHIKGTIEVVYIILISYVAIVYFYFYALKSSSNLLIYLVPVFTYSLLPSMLAYKTTFFQLIAPFLESNILSSMFYLNLRLSFIFIVHVVFLLFLLNSLIFYDINILLPFFELKWLLAGLSSNNVSHINTLSLCLSGVSTLNTDLSLINFELLIDYYTPGITGNSPSDLIVYSVPAVTELHGFVIFLHKFFIKLSFIDNLFILFIVFSSAIYINIWCRPIISY